MRTAYGKLGGWEVWGHASPGNFDFIKCNLVESGTVFAHIHNLPFLPFLKTQILTLICTSVANLVDCPGLLGCNTNDLD